MIDREVAEGVIKDKIALFLGSQEEGLYKISLLLSLHKSASSEATIDPFLYSCCVAESILTAIY